MEGKSAPPDMIPMSRSSRDYRASKNPKVSSEATSAPSSGSAASKKSQIRASGSPSRPSPATKKAKTGWGTLVGLSRAPSEIETSSGRSDSANHPFRPASRSKRAADSVGDVTLDALRPTKKSKIRKETAADSSPLKSQKSEGLRGKLNADVATLASKSLEVPPSSHALKIPQSGAGSAGSSSHSEETNALGGSASQISSSLAGESNAAACPEGEEQTEQRSLRPRPKPPAAKKVVKRTRFHEVALGEADGPRIVGRRIKVFWPLDKKWYYGQVKAFNSFKKQHKIIYDDHDEEWLKLQKEVFRLQVLSGDAFGEAGSASAAQSSAATNDTKSVTGDSNKLRGDATDEGICASADRKSIEGRSEHRIKADVPKERKRKVEGSSEENGKSEGTSERRKKTERGSEQNKNLEGGRKQKKKAEAVSEEGVKTEGRRDLRKREVKQRGSKAEKQGLSNVKRSGGLEVYQRRKKLVQGVISRGSSDRRSKGLAADGSSDRRKRAGKEISRTGSSIQIRTRHSASTAKEGKKASRRGIRDNDRLFPSVKSSGAVIRRKVAESKRSKDVKATESRLALSSEKRSEKHSHKPATKEVMRDDERNGGFLGRDVHESSLLSAQELPLMIEEKVVEDSSCRLDAEEPPLPIEKRIRDELLLAFEEEILVEPPSRTEEEIVQEPSLTTEEETVWEPSLALHKGIMEKSPSRTAEDVVGEVPLRTGVNLVTELQLTTEEEIVKVDSGGDSPQAERVPSNEKEVVGVSTLEATGEDADLRSVAEELLFATGRNEVQIRVDAIGRLHSEDRVCAAVQTLSVECRSGSGAALTAQLADMNRSGSISGRTCKEDRFQTEKELESDVPVEGSATKDALPMIIKVPTMQEVPRSLTPLTRPIPELKHPPDKVYQRLKFKTQDLSQRVAHFSKKVYSKCVKRAESRSAITSPLQQWSSTKCLIWTPHAFVDRTRHAALITRLGSWGRFMDCKLQLGMYYGAPGMQSLLRVSWRSLHLLLMGGTQREAIVALTDNAVNVTNFSEPVAFLSRKVRKIKIQVGFVSRTPFKRIGRLPWGPAHPGLPCRKSSRSSPLLLTLPDISRDLKCMTIDARHVKGTSLRPRALNFLSRPAFFLSQVEASGIQQLQMVKQQQASSSGQLAKPFIKQFCLESDCLEMIFSVIDDWTCRQSFSTSNDWLVSKIPVVPFLRGQNCQNPQSWDCREVGTYYGRRSLWSLLRVPGDGTGWMDVCSSIFRPSGGTVVTIDLKELLSTLADIFSGSGEAIIFSSLASSLRELCKKRDSFLVSSQSEIMVAEFERRTVPLCELETAYVDPGLCNKLAATGLLISSTKRIASCYGSVPRSLVTHDGLLMRTCAQEIEGSDAELAADFAYTGTLELSDPEDAAIFVGRYSTTWRTSSVHAVVDRAVNAATGGPMSFVKPESKYLSQTLVRMSQEDCKELGAYYGSPGVESLLQVSKDNWMRMLMQHYKVQQANRDQVFPSVPSTSKEAGILHKPQSPVLTSLETKDDEESSDLEDRMQASFVQGVRGDESSGGIEELGIIGNHIDDASKTSSRLLAPLKKGRRTGKVLKRGFVHIGGDVYGGDSLGTESMPGGDLLNGRPYSKRTRAEIEGSGAVVNTDNAMETSSPSSDLDGNGCFAPPFMGDQRANESSVPRVNVLKLRRCPTNKGLWRVAGNSCAAPQDRVMSVGSADVERTGCLNQRDFGEGAEPMTPIFETRKKRALDQCLESPSFGRSDQTGNSAMTSSENVVYSTHDQESTVPSVSSAKTYRLNSKSKEVWFDCGMGSINEGLPDGLEPRKRRRKGPSPVQGEDVDGISEHSMRRSTDSGWGSCSANVLLTKSDRCVRETGAVVELQPGHSSTWMLTVTLHGESKYSHKADQPVATGTSNKFTHAMIWRGGKDWSLEFVDRKQWQLFKDLHEECFQRSVRAASVRHIPIPGVKQIQECPKSGLRFVRPSSKYIHQFDGEVEMALASTRIIYDMDSEDEEWLNQVNNEKVSARGTRSRPRIEEDMLERVMDKLEKSSYVRQQDLMTSEVAADLCQTLGSQEVIRAIHGYWYDKRQRKGMALVRHFQPAPWEQYQKLLEEWQMKVNELQQESPTATKQQLQSLCKRPPLFAFCLRPRGLEVRNKMQKQRSQRRQGLSGSSSRPWSLSGPASDFFMDSPKRHAHFENASGPFYGSRRYGRQRIPEENFTDSMAVDLTESFNTLAGEGFTSSGGGGQVIADRIGVTYPQVESSSVDRHEKAAARGYNKARTKKAGRKARKMKLLASAEEFRRKRQLRVQQGHVKERFLDMVHSPHSLSELGQLPVDMDPSTSSLPLPQTDGEVVDLEAIAISKAAAAKVAREAAAAKRARAQALYAVADAAMHKAVAAVIAADAIHAAEKAVDEAAERFEDEPSQPVESPEEAGELAVALVGVKDDLVGRLGNRSEATGGGTSFGSWRRALNSASRNANHVLSKGTSSKPGLMTDTDDALLPVASWSQELGAGLGTRLLQTGEVSPQRQRYSPVLEGIAKSPTRVSLGRTRGESMMAMLTR